MGCQGKESREKLFNIYAKSLSEAIPRMIDTFRCPICLKDFNRAALDIDQALTFGHILPEALRGKICTLECGACNHYIGSIYDTHAIEAKRFNDWMNMAEGTERFIRVGIKEPKAPAYASWEKDRGLVIRAVNSKEPRYQEDSRRFESQIHQQGNFQFQMEVDGNFIPQRRDISLVHSAFLMMFFCFGYEYVLSQAADIVRHIIRCGDGPYEIGKMISDMKNESRFPIPSAGVIKIPRYIRAFVVLLPYPESPEYSRAVFLPGFGKSGENAFRRLMSMRTPTAGQISGNVNLICDGPIKYGYCKALWDKKSYTK